MVKNEDPGTSSPMGGSIRLSKSGKLPTPFSEALQSPHDKLYELDKLDNYL